MKLYLKLADHLRTCWRPRSIARKRYSTAPVGRPRFYNPGCSFSGNSQQVLSGNQSLSLVTSLITIPGKETWKTDLCVMVANLLSKRAPISVGDHHSLITTHYQHDCKVEFQLGKEIQNK